MKAAIVALCLIAAVSADYVEKATVEHSQNPAGFAYKTDEVKSASTFLPGAFPYAPAFYNAAPGYLPYAYAAAPAVAPVVTVKEETKYQAAAPVVKTEFKEYKPAPVAFKYELPAAPAVAYKYELPAAPAVAYKYEVPAPVAYKTTVVKPAVPAVAPYYGAAPYFYNSYAAPAAPYFYKSFAAPYYAAPAFNYGYSYGY